MLLDADSIDFILPCHNEAATIADLICTIRRWPRAARSVERLQLFLF
jgi:hypothetical protein